MAKKTKAKEDAFQVPRNLPAPQPPTREYYGRAPMVLPAPDKVWDLEANLWTEWQLGITQPDLWIVIFCDAESRKVRWVEFPFADEDEAKRRARDANKYSGGAITARIRSVSWSMDDEDWAEPAEPAEPAGKEGVA